MPRGVSKEKAARKIIVALGFDPDDPKSFSLIQNLYTPDTRLKKKIDEVEKLFAKGTLTQAERQALGYTLEEIVLLAFQGITGAKTLKSYQSAAAQHDLVVDGDAADIVWLAFLRAIHIHQSPGSGILIEAKATEKKVGDKEFERLGNILSHYFKSTIGIGIFVSINGASGFPTAGKRIKGLHSARLTQAVVYHSLGKPIIVLDWDDVKTLTKEGSLIRVIRSKVEAMEQLSGLKDALPAAPSKVDVPARLRPLVRLPS